MTQQQTGSMGDELTNAALIGLIGVFGIGLVLRAAGTITAFLTGTPQPTAGAAAGIAVLFNPADPATALGADDLHPVVYWLVSAGLLGGLAAVAVWLVLAARELSWGATLWAAPLGMGWSGPIYSSSVLWYKPFVYPAIGAVLVVAGVALVRSGAPSMLYKLARSTPFVWVELMLAAAAASHCGFVFRGSAAPRCRRSGPGNGGPGA